MIDLSPFYALLMIR